ncbi:MAG TPA: ribonuclease HII [Dermatophilaceae bacterium]|nr:ribonuclease HII [Dermatophilaceae bacterium]
MDEVGRGALAGPVTVGVVVVDEACRSAPQGVRDSKLLAPHVRERMVPRIHRWCLAHAVGHASPEEIDAVGIIAALRRAGQRALAALAVTPDLVILDGNHDWLTAPEEVGLLALLGGGVATPPVTTMVKADLRCSSVAAASVLAKVTRDAIMVGLEGEHPAYRWDENKGYAAPEHLEALRRHGPSPLHRRSWRLPGAVDEALDRPRHGSAGDGGAGDPGCGVDGDGDHDLVPGAVGAGAGSEER